MYLKNLYYLEALEEDDKRYQARIKIGELTLKNKDIKNIKYDLNINDDEKFHIGGVHGATATITILNYDGQFNNTNFDNKEFVIDLKIAIDDLYTVGHLNKELVGIINNLKIKHITSLWVPQGKFYPTKITKNENKTITIELTDKTKYLEDDYVCNLTPPFTLKRLYDDVHSQFQIISDTTTFYNQNQTISKVPTGCTGKEILGYIAECACGVYIINREGNGEIRQYGTEIVKSISKGKYKKFLPAENYITIQKIKYGNNTIGQQRGYILEIDEQNPFINNNVLQNILLKMQGFTFIPYTYNAINPDFAMDVADKFDITDTNDVRCVSYIMGNSWEYTGALTQEWNAKGENEFSNSLSSKGPINRQLDNINEEIEDINETKIPDAYNRAVNKATELLTQFNGGYVIKKDGELYIADNQDLDRAQHIWRWNINGLGYSSTGINGQYGLAMTMNGQIVADFISTGKLSANVIDTGSITAEKLSLSANDVLNIIAGNTINMTTKNLVINSTNLSIDENGNLTCSNADITGKVTASSGEIGGWKVNSNYLSSGTGAGTVKIMANTSSDTNYVIAVGSETNSSAPFRVRRNGQIYASTGEIGGWTIGTNSLISGTGTSTVKIISNASSDTSYAIVIGSETNGQAPFRVRRNGQLYATNATITGGDFNIISDKDQSKMIIKGTNNRQTKMWGGGMGFYSKIRATPDYNTDSMIGIDAADNFAGIDIYSPGAGGHITIDTGDLGCFVKVSQQGTSTMVKPTGVEPGSLAETKKNFEKMLNALEIIKDIDIYKYNYNIEDDTVKKHIGFVIGENFKYSEEVTSNDNKGVDLYSFVSLCCQAIKELSLIIKETQKEKGV